MLLGSNIFFYVTKTYLTKPVLKNEIIRYWFLLFKVKHPITTLNNDLQ